jgi:hypothetical protein
MTPSRRRRAPQRRKPRRAAVEPPDEQESAEEVVGRGAAEPRLSGGDVDADWRRADSVGEEAVGGSVTTPDQDVVDEIGRALGVEQESDAEVVTSDEILRRRDRLRWHLDRDADERERQDEERQDGE